MSKKKPAPLPVPKDAPVIAEPDPVGIAPDGKGEFRIGYRQGEEDIELTFGTPERRDSEASRLRSMGIECERYDWDANTRHR